MTTVTVTGFTAARTLEIEETAIVEGKIVGDNLVLTNRRGEDQVAGNVRGNKGDKGDAGGVWDATDALTGGVRLAGNLGGTATVPKVKGALEATVDLSSAMIKATVVIDGTPQDVEFSASYLLGAVLTRFNDPVLTPHGDATDFFVGNITMYNALSTGLKNKVGFVGVIR